MTRGLISVLLTVVVAAVVAAPLHAQDPTSPDSAVTHWARAQAIPLHSVDDPYSDTSFAFLRPLVGQARILAVGELVHGGHQPLAFRNEVVRYAVAHLGVTAIAIESGVTESAIVDRFIQGGPGNIDTVVRTGFTWEFERLPENRELVQILRQYNATATRKVHFFGLDLTGANDSGTTPLAANAVVAALDYLGEVAPARGAALRSRLTPLMDRFLPRRYAELPAADRARLASDLDSLHQALVADSAHAVRATSEPAYARGLRDAWMAERLNALMNTGGGDTTVMLSALVGPRDSMMAEDVRWVLTQVRPNDRLLVFAHNGHVMNAGTVSNGVPGKVLGQYLRAWYGPKLVIIGSVTSAVVGGVNGIGGWVGDTGVAHADPASFAAALAGVGLATFVVDRRTGEHIPAVASAFARPWTLMFTEGQYPPRPIIPHEAFDAVVYFDRDTQSHFR